MRILKICLAIMLLICFIMLNQNSTYAADSLSEIITEGDDFIGARSKDEVIDTDALKDTSDFIYKTLLIIAIVLAFIVGMIIGIQFIIGSAEEKAKIKETLIPYIVGLIVVFGAFTIWKIVVNLGNEIAPTPEATGTTETACTTTEEQGTELHSRQNEFLNENINYQGKKNKELYELWTTNNVQDVIIEKIMKEDGITHYSSVTSEYELGSLYYKIYNECRIRNLLEEKEGTYSGARWRKPDKTITYIKFKDEYDENGISQVAHNNSILDEFLNGNINYQEKTNDELYELWVSTGIQDLIIEKIMKGSNMLKSYAQVLQFEMIDVEYIKLYNECNERGTLETVTELYSGSKWRVNDKQISYVKFKNT